MTRASARLAPGLFADDRNGVGPTAAPADALVASRVDLVKLISDGIPAREVVPGAGHPLAGKRYLWPAPTGVGKSLAALILAVDVVEAGGLVVILDVENGGDEYARRLDDVLAARDGDGTLAVACSNRLLYYAWPALRATWNGDEWAAALYGADLVIFDSSRFVLSMCGLAEDSNDDYAEFVSGLLLPLTRVGITTLTLDNAGHEERDRARGASAKADLNEVVYTVGVGENFDRERPGSLRLVRRRTRFADLPGELRISVGGGVYGPVKEVEAGSDSDGFRPTA